MFTLSGTGIGGGIVIGRARVLESRRFDVVRYHLAEDQREAEQARLRRALGEVKADLAALADELPAEAPTEARALLEVHSMILDDPSLADASLALVQAQGWNAEWALSHEANALAEQFAAFDDPYLRERGRDVQQVTDRVIKSLAGMRVRPVSGEPAIYVASDIAPGDMLALKNALGFAIDLGGTTSHTAILARSMNLPAVVGLGSASGLVEDDEWLILDGDAGVLVVGPDEPLLAEYRRRQAEQIVEREKLLQLVHVRGRTRDGVTIGLQANIELPEEAQQARDLGADGIGLFRSEFLFMNRRDLPSEDEQYEAYRASVLAMRGRPVTIRTLDIGADKALQTVPAAIASNPALGQRAIRLCLAEPAMFLVQLRAILRAAEHGPVRILLPMLAHRHEIDQSLLLIARAREQLRDDGAHDGPGVAVGGMIEVPAAALSVRMFLRRLDFLSIGTNDLIQYTLAIDRADHAVAPLYDPFHPAVLKLIAGTIRAATRAAKPVAVCGEMAGEVDATRLLVGMGLREFSMHTASLLPVKREVLATDAARAAERVARVLRTDEPLRAATAIRGLRGD
jgi:phosphotransferase system enzyme I (PtsI)